MPTASAPRAMPGWMLWSSGPEDNKDVAGVECGAARAGLSLAAFSAEPRCAIVDAATHAAFLDAVRESVAAAKRLGAPTLIVLAGDELKDRLRARAAQRDRRGAPAGRADRRSGRRGAGAGTAQHACRPRRLFPRAAPPRAWISSRPSATRPSAALRCLPFRRHGRTAGRGACRAWAPDRPRARRRHAGATRAGQRQHRLAGMHRRVAGGKPMPGRSAWNTGRPAIPRHRCARRVRTCIDAFAAVGVSCGDFGGETNAT